MASIAQLIVMLHFVRTAREPQEAVVDEAEIINRRSGAKLSVV